MERKDRNRLIKDINRWNENIENHYLLYGNEGQFSLLGWLAHRAGIPKRYLSGWTFLTTLVISRISDHYNMGSIEGPRTIFRLRYTVNQCKKNKRIEGIKAGCVSVLERGSL